MCYAFDFDGVLDSTRIQNLIKKIRRENNEIWVVANRSENNFNKNIIAPIIMKSNLIEQSVIYCDNKPKWEILQIINADIYIDNEESEFEVIKNHTNTIPLLYHD